MGLIKILKTKYSALVIFVVHTVHSRLLSYKNKNGNRITNKEINWDPTRE